MGNIAIAMGGNPGWEGGWGGGPWWPVFPIFWLLIAGLVVWSIVRFRREGGGSGSRSADAVLADRFARGEINVDEYRERLKVLKDAR